MKARGEPLWLSYAQQRLWFLHQYQGPSAVYNMPLALRLQGEVDEASLVRSLEELHHRHESLRTHFEAHEFSAVQVIDAPGLVLKVETVTALEVQELAQAERCYRFDLWKDRLCRIRLLREMDSTSCDYVLLVTLHHSVSDGWSMGVFFRELVSLYRAYRKGEETPLAPLPIQYADYAQWQRRWLQGEVLERQVSYWREQLKELPPLLTLPTDRPRPAEQSFNGRTENFVLPAVLAERLQGLSREQGVTLYMTLLSAFAVLLGRYAGQSDVAVGTPIANRTRRETEGLIGFFVNLLVMRHDLSGDPSFVELLKRTRVMALQAYAHQDVPFEQLVEELKPERSVSHSPLFQVAFGLVNTPFEAVELAGVTVLPLQEEAEEEQDGTSRFDLTLNMQETPSGLVGGLEYSTDLFDRQTMRRLLDQYTRLLESIVGSPQLRLSQLEMLSDEEKRQQLIDWNARGSSDACDQSVHERFEAQVERTPEAIAVEDDRQSLTYRKLNERANQFAHRLIEQGVGPEARVAISAEGEVQRAVGVLGILKAGSAYVPLSGDDPAERLDYLLADSGSELRIESSSVCDTALQSYPLTNPGIAVSAAALACVRYELDDVGVAVGRMVSHAGLLASSNGLMEALLRWPTGRLACLPKQAEAHTVARYVLGSHWELLPLGAVGALYVEGEAAGWGYRHRAGLTAQRFIPNAFSAVPGARLYWTGERARWRADGRLELIEREEPSGRDQAEDLFELERALLRHESVREAAVLAAPRKPLTAYVVERAPGAVLAKRFIAQLQAHLRAQPTLSRLPHEWVVLDALPRTEAGVVDRSGLLQPPSAEPTYVAPRTVLERTLAEVWQEQLGVERVGVEENYFGLGGDSIRSIGLVAQARARGVEFSIKDLFAYPTVSALALAIERGEVRSSREVEKEVEPFGLLTEAEREWLSQQHDMERVEDAYPLSMMQQGMVVEALRYADLKVYLNFQIYELKDPWDPQLFEQALRHLLVKHPVLRTIHDFSATRPLQLVLKEPVPQLQVVDIRGADEAAVQTALDQWMRSEQAAGLDTTTSLWRAAVHVLPGEKFLFGMYLHHALWDGWSLESFVTELYATYGLLKREGRVAEYRRLPSYKQFIALEQSALSSKEHRTHWLQKLDRVAVPWWTGRKKSGNAYMACEISEQTGQALSQLARTLGVQEKSIWCAVYLALLSLLNGTEEVVGTAITQGRPEIRDGEKMIGLFLNALPMRVTMSGRWVDLISAADRELTEQHAFGHYPLAEIQRLTGLDFSGAMFNYSNWHVYYEGVEREGTKEEWIPQKLGGWHETNHLLSVLVHKDEKAQGYYVGIGADAQVFDAAFRERIRGYVSRIVDAMAGDATALIDRTQLLSAEERHRQLVEWNATERSYPDGHCIHELFEAQVARTPDRIALVDEGNELTYVELNRRANQLAHRLIERGVGPEVRVGLCMERSPELVIGMLGILKAGGCYVPLDPSYPPKRLEYLIKDSGVDLIVNERLVEEWGGKGPSGNPATAVVPANLAYVIYTSGSTGQPKGVGIVHRSAVSLLSWSGQQWSVAERAGVLASTSICFDLSIYELFVPLTQGNQCVLIDSILRLGELSQRERVSLINTVPSAAKALLEKGGLPGSLRAMNLAGEPLKAELVDALYESSEAGCIYDLYGPSEGTTYSTYALRSAQGRETIGRPVANTQAYVMDGEGELLPSGVVGELYLGGVGLARGYLGRASLTAERFVPHPFSEESGARLYRTGDLVRWLADGALEYLGRVDHQVKVRGFRIELGEIETVLLGHEAVRDTVVIVREEGGDKRLVGYVVVKSVVQTEEAALIQALRQRLQEQLPGYMVPSALMVLESLPLTANGKVDRQALPVPDSARFQTEFVAPRNEVERSLCNYWKNLLKIERVGIHDDFWVLGGHSLLAIQVSNFARQQFGVELKLSELFATPSVAQLAECISLELDASILRSKRVTIEIEEDFEEGSF